MPTAVGPVMDSSSTGYLRVLRKRAIRERQADIYRKTRNSGVIIRPEVKSCTIERTLSNKKSSMGQLSCFLLLYVQMVGVLLCLLLGAAEHRTSQH